MTPSQIDEVVRTFLEQAKGTSQPYHQLPELLMRLQAEGWSDEDVRQVQGGIFSGLAPQKSEPPRT